MKKILFLGTSYLVAIKEGWDEKYANSLNYQATFVGLNGPSFVANLKHLWEVVDGKLVFPETLECFISTQVSDISDCGIHYAKKSTIGASKTFLQSFKASSVSVDIQRFDCIVFVDMFFRYNQVFKVTQDGYVLRNSVPVSTSLLKNMHLQGFNGYMELSDHPRFGDVEFQNSRTVIQLITKSTAKPCYLIAAPRPPASNIDLTSRYGSIKEAQNCFDFIENFYGKSLSLPGISFICQPKSVLDENHCLTRNSFSRGGHSSGKQGLLDGHMNKNYGLHVIKDLVKKINKNEQT